MLSIDELQILLLILVGAGAGFVQRVSGFGLGIFAMLFLPYFMPSHAAAAAVSCLFSCGTSLYNAARYRRDISFRTLLPLLCAAMAVIPVAVHFSAAVPEKLLKALLGVVLIALSVYFLFFSQRVHIRPTVVNGVLAGGVGGLLNGLFSTGGPPVVLYLVHATSDKMVYFATIQFYFAATNIYSTAVRVANGIITWEILLYAAIGMAGCALGNLIGTRVFNKLNAQRVKQVIYAGMIISGVLMIV